MSTGSTKSRDKHRRHTAEAVAPPPPEPDVTVMDERMWRIACALVLLLAAALRLYALELKPLHHDEGVNGFFLTKLIESGIYEYDPANYHGPTLYYFTLIIVKLFKFLGLGLSTFTIRLVPVLFGLGAIWLILCLRRRIGAVGALAAASLMALSPGSLYLSRYFIHESLFVFFTLGIVAAALRYYDTTNPIYLTLAAVSAALMFATKETAIVSAGVLVIAWGMSAGYARLRRGGEVEAPVANPRRQRDARSKGHKKSQPSSTGWAALSRFGKPPDLLVISLIALVFFLVVYLLFYSSFLTHAQGIKDSLKTFEFWTKTGKRDHVHEWYMYLKWLWLEESPLLALGACGVCLAFLRSRGRFPVFAALWAIGIISAYSLIPYKTPWLMMNFLLPLAIIGGYAIDAFYLRDAHELPGRALALVLASAALLTCTYQTIQLNFVHYDDDQYVYVYAHTRREFLPMIDEITRLAASPGGAGLQTPITVVSQDYWPLPWYLRDYKRVAYPNQVTVTNEAIVVGSEAQAYELEAALGDRYQKVGEYVLRPNVTLLLYARGDLLRR